MLKQLSRLEKTRNTILLLFVVLLAISMVIFYAPSRDTATGENLSRSQETAATVGSETITVSDVVIGQENRARQYAQYGMSNYTPPAKDILDGEILSRIVRLEAARLNLTASDAEVAEEIRNFLKTQGMDSNNKEAYRRLVTENFGSVERFEQSFRDDLAQEKLNAFLTSGVSVSEEEVLKTFKENNTSFEVVYVPVSALQLAEKMQPGDEDLRAYFEKNKDTYKIKDPQKKIRYLFINQSKVGEKLDIPEADLREEYDALAPDKKQQGVQAQQIVLKFAKPEDEQNVSAKAGNLVAEARKDGGKISEEAFGNLAKGNSEDAKTAQNGGKVAGLVRQNLTNPEDPLQKILPLEVGQVTEPQKFGNAYYIFRRGEAVPKTFEDAKPELMVSLRNRRAFKAAADLTDKAVARLKEVGDVRKVAEEFAPQANMKADEMVRETGFVKPGDDVPNIGVAPQFEEGILPLDSAGQVGERTPIKDGFAVPVLLEKRDPRDAEFDEVKDQVTAAVKLEQAKAKVEQIANEIAGGASSPDALKGLAEKYGLKAGESKAYKYGTPLGEAGVSSSSEALSEAVYNLKAGEVTKAIKDGENYFVVGAVKRTEANMDEFAKQRDQLVDSALFTKKGQFFQDYLSNLRQKMEKEGRIKIYKEALAKLDGVKPADPQS